MLILYKSIIYSKHITVTLLYNLICYQLSHIFLCQLFNFSPPLIGQCRCKANVEGRACDQCKRGFYNFMNPEGCEPCDCDPNGSYATYCDPVSGQCPCKPHLAGRKCDIPVVNFNTSGSTSSSSQNQHHSPTSLEMETVNPTETITNNVIEANTEGALDSEITASAITDVKREESTESTSSASE